MASGAAGALAHAFRLVTEPGDEILTFAPFFPEYHPYVDLTGAVPVSYTHLDVYKRQDTKSSGRYFEGGPQIETSP